ncbi:phBC6A51 family helix-turn-helix protein [Paenibacillus sp. J2TS4]|uniref:phBC6A51 family helix-turn-helix protein n=1 Tax=Paenibacillus sp. J2TS4 TaxID=2807194 RepID=UPI001B2C6B28|nr:phBC6A51 family helix-turn-helix protein [Paenibacillus sp. J2TS4]GIP33612.1 hypothetical protein J2TS4_28220 [Paenibacillus sp. J2TS4]
MANLRNRVNEDVARYECQRANGNAVPRRIATGNFNEQQTLAIELLAVKGRRSLGTIAAQIGVDVRTLNRWRQEPSFKEAVIDKSKNEYLGAGLPEVFAKHLELAIAGNVKAIELYYKVTGLFVEKKEIHPVIDDRSNEAIERDIDKLDALLDEIDKEPIH